MPPTCGMRAMEAEVAPIVLEVEHKLTMARELMHANGLDALVLEGPTASPGLPEAATAGVYPLPTRGWRQRSSRYSGSSSSHPTWKLGESTKKCWPISGPATCLIWFPIPGTKGLNLQSSGS